MQETKKLRYSRASTNVIEFLDDVLPTYMKRIHPEFAEIFTTRTIRPEWTATPSVTQIKDDLNCTKEEATTIYKKNADRKERFKKELIAMVGVVLDANNVMHESSCERLIDFDEVGLKHARDTHDIIAILNIILQSHLCTGTTITRADIDQSENEVRNLKMQENESIGNYTKRVNAALKKATALNPSTTMANSTAVYYYSQGLTNHPCQEIRQRVIEWKALYNQHINHPNIPTSIHQAHNHLKTIMSNVGHVEPTPETALAMDRERRNRDDDDQETYAMNPRQRQRTVPPRGGAPPIYSREHVPPRGGAPPNYSRNDQSSRPQVFPPRPAQTGYQPWQTTQRRETGAKPTTINQRLRGNEHLSGKYNGNGCFVCGQQGHWARHCPERKKHDAYVLDTYYADDNMEQDEYVEQQFADESEQEKYNPVNINEERCYVISLPLQQCYTTDITTQGLNPSTRVNMDNHSTIHIFHNAALLQGLHKLRIPIAVNGAGELRITQAGYHPMLGLVYYSPNFKHNIISLMALNAIGYYEQKDIINQDKISHLINPTSGHQLTFTRQDNKFYSIDARELTRVPSRHEYICIPAEISTKHIFTKLQRDRAELAHRMHVLMYHPSDDTLGALLDYNGVINAQITSTDLQNARIIYGQCRECSEAKPRSGPIPNRKRFDNTDPIAGTEIQTDIVFVNGKPKLLTIVREITYGVYSPLEDKSSKVVLAAIKIHIAKLETPYKKIRTMVTDNDKTFTAMENDLTQLNIKMDHAIPYEHCKRVERYVRNIRIKITIIQASVPFKIPLQWYDYLIPDVILKLNHTPNKHTTPHTPSMFVNGERLNVNTMKATFGQCVIVSAGSDKATLYRYRAIVLKADEHTEGYYVWIFETEQILIRRVEEYITTTPIDIINKINGLAKQINTPPDDIIIYKNHSYKEIVNDDETGEQHNNNKSDNKANGDTTTKDGGNTDIATDENGGNTDTANNEDGGNTDTATNEDGGNTNTATNENGGNTDIATNGDTMDAIANADGGNTDTAINDNLRRSTRPHVPTIRYSTFTITHDMEDMKIQARRAEIRQLMDNKTWIPIHSQQERTPSIHKVTLRCIMRLTEKYKIDGSLDKIKARLCAMGNNVDMEAYEVFEKTAPTISNMTYMSLLNYAVAAKQQIEIFDVTAAFVQSSLDIDKRHVIILPEITIPYILEIDPTYQHYIQPNGTILAELRKSLYGLPEAGRVWFDQYTKILLNLGYERSEHDKCCYKKKVDKSIILIGVHVDDALLIYDDKSKWMRDELYKTLDMNNIKYRPNILTTTNPIQYLQTNIHMLKDGTIVLHQIPKLKKLFQDKEALKNMQPRPTPTPAIPTTAINDDKPCDKTTYLSYLMTLYHIAHKYRYDILNACSMLSCIPNPTIKDWHSLMYLYGYVKNTMNYCLHINPSKIEHEINISADSAYAVHINDHHKSHTGYIIYYGDSPIHAKSVKQTNVCDSSSYAELVAMHASIEPGMFIKSIYEFIGITNARIIIHQDNTQSIRTTYDTTSTSHKYLDIKHSYLQDLIKRQIIQVKYQSGDEIVADILASPRAGRKFQELREKLGIVPLE